MNLYFYIAEFVVAVVLVLLYYKFVETRNIKRYNKNNMPADLKLFIKTQHVDTKRINNKTLMTIVALINAVNVGLTLLLTNLVDSFLLKFLIAIPSMLVLLFVSYKIVGLILKKKGMTKNES